MELRQQLILKQQRLEQVKNELASLGSEPVNF
jgi:hypothetical protein